MVRSIVVPLDGSRTAERALPLAVAVATGAGARLVLVRVVSEGDGAGAEAGADTYLAGIRSRLELAGARADAVVRGGEVVPAILAAAEDAEADLVVLATHGRSGLGRWLYGSVAEGVLVGARVPVLLARASGSAERMPIAWRGRPILVALDGSAAAERVLAPAAELAVALGAGLALLRVVPVDVALPPEMGAFLSADGPLRAAAEEGEARAYLDGLVVPMEGRSLRVERRVARAVSPAEAILGEARALGAGLVALGSHGRTGLGRVLFGSVAHEVLHQGGPPLLILRAATPVPALR